MRVQLDPPSSVNPTTTLEKLPTNSSTRLQDSFVTMAKRDGIRGFFKAGIDTGRDFVKTVWEWVFWAISLFPSANTRIEAVEDLIENPLQTANNCDKKPAEFLGEIIAATLISPTTVDKMRNDKRKQVGKFVKRFKEVVLTHEALIMGTNSVLKGIQSFLSIFTGLKADHVLVKFILARPHITSGAIKAYCKKALSKIGERELNNLTPGAEPQELISIKAVIQYFDKVANQAQTDPTNFRNFIAALFSLKSMDFEEVGRLAEKHLENAKPTPQERLAFRKCSENKHLPLKRLNMDPHFLHTELEEAKLGKQAIYQALFSKLSPQDFEALAGIFKKEYPLASEVCEHLEDISKNPSQFKTVCSNLPRAHSVIMAMVGDYQNPPPSE